MRLLHIGFFFGLTAALQCCKSATPLSGHDISDSYTLNTEGVQANSLIVSSSNGQSRLMVRVKSSTVVRDKNAEGDFYNSLALNYRLYTSYSAPAPLDSGRLVLKEKSLGSGEYFLLEMPINVPVGRSHILEVEVRDMLGARVHKEIIDVENPQSFSSQSYMLSNMDGSPIYESFITEADSYHLVVSDPQTDLFVKYYDRDFPVAQPPFSAVHPKPFNFKPDRLDRVKMIDEHQGVVYITQKGFYQIVNQEEAQHGGSIHYFGKYYPDAKTVNDLLYPMRYITTNAEYEDLLQSKNLKQSIDAFWLRLGGDKTRARKLIKSYYSRVEATNSLFTSYIEGWKSDRGMCYIVFGQPSKVLRSTATEVWIYGEEGNYNALRLEFVKVVNPFSKNDFRLKRSASLKSPWYRAVDYWRQGRIITIR